MLARLSVFVGSFELDAAEVVCANGEVAGFSVAGLIGSLVDKSLVVTERSSASLRYRLLETIRQYAADKLVAMTGEHGRGQARSAHAEYYLRLAEVAAPKLSGVRQGSWLKRLDFEWDNVRAAFAYLLADRGRTEDVLRLGVALQRFFFTRGHLDPIASLRAALERSCSVPVALRARALYVTGYLVGALLGPQARFELRAARGLHEQALQLAQALDDQELAAEALTELCCIAALQEKPRQATLLGGNALELARTTNDPRLIGGALSGLAMATRILDDKRALHLEALACFRRAGDIFYVCFELRNLGIVEAEDGKFEAARAYYEEAVASAEGIGASQVLTWLWNGLGFVLRFQGEFDEAALWCRKSLIGSRRLGQRRTAAFALFLLACCATGIGDYSRAAKLTGASDAIEADIVAVTPQAYVWTSIEQQVRDDNWARLRQALGDREFERSYAVGRGLTFEAATDLALGRARSG